MKSPTTEEWAAGELAADAPAAAPKGISEEEITAKVRLGLDRAQAIEILTNQAAHDATLASEEKKAAKLKSKA